jgi:calcineurin-like phosphoesterase family protein
MSERVFVCSDLHLGHALVAKTRGFGSVEEHNEAILDNLADAVLPKDTLWVLGDVVFSASRYGDLLSRIPGHVKLVLGNHDSLKVLNRYRVFEQVYGAAYGKKGILFTHIPVHPRQKDRFSLNVHGHLHTEVLPDPWYFNVCLEQNNLKPFNMEEIYEKIPLLPLVGDTDQLCTTITRVRQPDGVYSLRGDA